MNDFFVTTHDDGKRSHGPDTKEEKDSLSNQNEANELTNSTNDTNNTSGHNDSTNGTKNHEDNNANGTVGTDAHKVTETNGTEANGTGISGNQENGNNGTETETDLHQVIQKNNEGSHPNVTNAYTTEQQNDPYATIKRQELPEILDPTLVLKEDFNLPQIKEMIASPISLHDIHTEFTPVVDDLEQNSWIPDRLWKQNQPPVLNTGKNSPPQMRKNISNREKLLKLKDQLNKSEPRKSNKQTPSQSTSGQPSPLSMKGNQSQSKTPQTFYSPQLKAKHQILLISENLASLPTLHNATMRSGVRPPHAMYDGTNTTLSNHTKGYQNQTKNTTTLTNTGYNLQWFEVPNVRGRAPHMINRTSIPPTNNSLKQDHQNQMNGNNSSQANAEVRHKIGRSAQSPYANPDFHMLGMANGNNNNTEGDDRHKLHLTKEENKTNKVAARKMKKSDISTPPLQNDYEEAIGTIANELMELLQIDEPDIKKRNLDNKGERKIRKRRSIDEKHKRRAVNKLPIFGRFTERLATKQQHSKRGKKQKKGKSKAKHKLRFFSAKIERHGMILQTKQHFHKQIKIHSSSSEITGTKRKNQHVRWKNKTFAKNPTQKKQNRQKSQQTHLGAKQQPNEKQPMEQKKSQPPSQLEQRADQESRREQEGRREQSSSRRNPGKSMDQNSEPSKQNQKKINDLVHQKQYLKQDPKLKTKINSVLKQQKRAMRMKGQLLHKKTYITGQQGQPYFGGGGDGGLRWVRVDPDDRYGEQWFQTNNEPLESHQRNGIGVPYVAPPQTSIQVSVVDAAHLKTDDALQRICSNARCEGGNEVERNQEKTVPSSSRSEVNSRGEGSHGNLININIDEDEQHEPPVSQPHEMIENNVIKPAVRFPDNHQNVPVQRQESDEGTRHQEVVNASPVETAQNGAVDRERDDDEIRGAIRSIPANDDRSINKLVSMLNNNEQQSGNVLRYLDQQQQERSVETSNGGSGQSQQLNEENQSESNERTDNMKVDSNDNDGAVI